MSQGQRKLYSPLKITETQNNFSLKGPRVVTWSSLLPTVGLISVAQAPVHLCFQYFKKWKLCNISGPPAVVFNHLHCEDFFFLSDIRISLDAVCVCYLTSFCCTNCEVSGSIFSVGLPWNSEGTNETLMSLLFSRLNKSRSFRFSSCTFCSSLTFWTHSSLSM